MANNSAPEFKVVLNHEEQYSIWPVWKPDPPGWREEGMKGSKDECLQHIEKVWTDMRPLSLRKWMAEHIGDSPQKKIEIPVISSDGTDYFHQAQPPNELVKRLMVEQGVKVIRYQDRATNKPDKKALLRAAENGYILIKFTNTHGGTEIGCNVKNEDSRCFSKVEGDKLTFAGRLKLDYTPLLVHAAINLESFDGTARVEVIDDWKAAK